MTQKRDMELSRKAEADAHDRNSVSAQGSISEEEVDLTQPDTEWVEDATNTGICIALFHAWHCIQTYRYLAAVCCDKLRIGKF